MSMFRNEQWVVTEDGMRSVRWGAPKEVRIEADRLLDRGTGADSGDYDVPLTMARKAWIDIEAFVEAYVAALEIHAGRLDGSPDPERLLSCIDRARRMVRKREESRWI